MLVHLELLHMCLPLPALHACGPHVTHLLPPPEQGIIGTGYERMLAKDAAFNGNAVDFTGHEEEYRMAAYFDTNHLHNRSAATLGAHPSESLQRTACQGCMHARAVTPNTRNRSFECMA